MSHENKRYIVYYYAPSSFFTSRVIHPLYLSDSKDLWARKEYTKKQFLSLIRRPFFTEHLVDSFDDYHKATSYTKIMKGGRILWKENNTYLYCVRLIHEGVERKIDIASFIKEANLYKKKTPCCHHFKYHGYRSWKTEKCSHQWEKNVKKHIDTISLSKREVYLQEEDC